MESGFRDKEEYENGQPEPIFGTRQLGDLAAYVRASIRRHRWLFTVVAVGVTAIAVAAAIALPRTYEAQARVLAVNDNSMMSLANPDRPIPWDAEATWTNVAPMVMSQANLAEIVDEVGLVERWNAHRPDLLRLKDQLAQLVFGPMSEDDLEAGLVSMLEDRLSVTLGEDNGVLTFTAAWTDPETSVLLANALVQKFLEERKRREAGAVEDTVAVLEKHAADEQQRVVGAIENLRKARTRWAKRTGRDISDLLEKDGAADLTELQAELARVDARIEQKRAAIREVEMLRARQQNELSGEYGRRSTVLGPEHPDMVELRRTIDEFDPSPPELERLQQQEANLLRRQRQLEVQVGRTLGPEAGGNSLRAARAALEVQDPSEHDDPDVAYARTRVGMALTKYENVLDRISGAQIELDTANAAFRYRYSLLSSPKAPEAPSAPNPPALIVAGLLSGLLLGGIFAVGAEATGRRILLPWQAERHLGLPFLGLVGEK